MDKQQILGEIRRIAKSKGGKPPGRDTFERETGVRECDWYPHFWLRWGDALVEAGLPANEFNARIDDDVIARSFANLVRELGRIPLSGEMIRKRQSDKTFPDAKVFRRFGNKSKLLETVIRYCREKSGYDDVISLCEERNSVAACNEDANPKTAAKIRTGFVYLMKSGRHYKIGRTVSVGSRERQLAVKIPIPPKTIYAIETDDPVGIEAYWHNRFRGKRGEGEWFDLSPEEVAAFKRWRRIV